MTHKVDGVDVEWQPSRTVEDSIIDDMKYFKVLADDLNLELKMLSGKGLAEIHAEIKKLIDKYAGGDPKQFHHKLLILTGKNDSVERRGKEICAKKSVSNHNTETKTNSHVPCCRLLG